MKLFNLNILFFLLVSGSFMLHGCIGNLDVSPIDPNYNTSETVYKTEEDLLKGLGKLYNGLSHTGQLGPDGDQDLQEVDEGTSNYWRTYWNIQELSTDEAINGWNDDGLLEVNFGLFGSSNLITRAMYYRLIYQVTLVNEFIRQANNVMEEDWTNAPGYIAEARFIRALVYYNCLELFGNGVPFVTEDDGIGTFLPEPAGQQFGDELFLYLENELRQISGLEASESGQLIPMRMGFVGRADQGAALTLLAKLYLNHKNFFSEDGSIEDSQYYVKASQVLTQLMDGTYGLVSEVDLSGSSEFSPYQSLFLADNHLRDKEIIYQLSYDSRYSQTWGGATFLVCAGILNNMTANTFGVNEGWNGNRALWNVYHFFKNDQDQRAMDNNLFYTEGREIDGKVDIKNAGTGFGIGKFRNINSDGTLAGNQGNNVMVDVNVPVFRYADVVLMAAEVELRLGNFVTGTRLNELNALQERAGLPLLNTIEVTLDWILQERGRELYWEGHRRTDLIRFNKYTSNESEYIWPYKGGVRDGGTLPLKSRWIPLPASDLAANPNLVQNKGY